jgi:hypothetical protein
MMARFTPLIILFQLPVSDALESPQHRMAALEPRAAEQAVRFETTPEAP